MELRPITYRGRLVALATAEWCVFCGELEGRPIGDPERTFVLFMCLYAADVVTGVLPGPYTDARARRSPARRWSPGNYSNEHARIRTGPRSRSGSHSRNSPSPDSS